METTAIMELRCRDVVHKPLVLFHDKLLLLRRMEMLMGSVLQALQASLNQNLTN